MNIPAPTPISPTPNAQPTTAGILQGLLTGWGTYKLSAWLGVPPEDAMILAGAVVSSITSGFHKLAQSAHWKL